MKAIRRLPVLLVVMLMMCLMAAPAFADYTAVRPGTNGGKVEITEKLTITNGDTVPNATYTFAVEGGVSAYTKDGVTYGSTTAVAGNPKFANGKNSVTFNNSSDKDASGTNPSVSGKVELDFSDVEISQPGIYYWKITKTSSPTKEQDQHLTNAQPTMFAVVRVIDKNGALELDSYGLVHTDGSATNPQPGIGGKIIEVDDEYTGEWHDLKVEKAVSGALASKEEYFKFTVTIEGATKVGGNALSIDTAYGAGTAGATVHFGEVVDYSNPNKINIDDDGKGEVEVWLKNGQYVTIKGIPDGASYKVVESELNGYKPNVEVTGDTTGYEVSSDKATVSDPSLGADAGVKYINEKDSTTPTGIILQAAAPLAGILLALALVAVVIVSKRRRAQVGAE